MRAAGAALALVVVLGAGAPAAAAADPLRPSQWGLGTVRAPEAWGTARGQGVVIAVVDTGVDLAHEDLVDRLVPGWDFVEGNGRPQDREGHGTHVAGIAAATAGNGRGIAGVAPRARIMPVRVLDANGTGRAANVARGIRWAVDNGARVINLSLGNVGQAVFGPEFGDALGYAWSRGAVPVVAAGNDFLLSSGYAEHPALVVAATDRRDRKPTYSSGVGSARWGMAAPGGSGSALAPREDDIISTHWRQGERNRYAYLAGTSMAAPHVAGAAAILLSLGLTPRRTVDRLLATARDIGPSGRDATFGHGRLDVAAAVRGLGPRREAAPPGSPAAEAERAAAPDAPEAPAPAPDREGAAPEEPREDPVAVDPPPGQGVAPARGGDPPDGGLPVLPIGIAMVVGLIAALVGWALFRPSP